jgi:hypothetical protein
MNFSRVGEGVFFIHPERVLRADACRQHGAPLHRAAASFNKELQRIRHGAVVCNLGFLSQPSLSFRRLALKTKFGSSHNNGYESWLI